ncbi:MAG TPA: hypothetical protein VMF06_21975 [Candidatus Limnocylindria bacterium]|nr:hypothetical protein [Candidatus Limnocylindria bacterium]
MNRYPWYPDKTPARYVFGGGGLLIAWVKGFLLIREQETWGGILLMVLSSFLLFLFLESFSFVDSKQGLLIQESWFLGRVLVRRKRTPLGEFSGVAVLWETSEGDVWAYYGLIRRKGRFLKLGYVNDHKGRPSEVADEIVSRFAKESGLPVCLDLG